MAGDEINLPDGGGGRRFRSKADVARIAKLEAALEQIAALNDLGGYEDQCAAAYGHLAQCEEIARKALGT